MHWAFIFLCLLFKQYILNNTLIIYFNYINIYDTIQTQITPEFHFSCIFIFFSLYFNFRSASFSRIMSIFEVLFDIFVSHLHSPSCQEPHRFSNHKRYHPHCSSNSHPWALNRFSAPHNLFRCSAVFAQRIIVFKSHHIGNHREYIHLSAGGANGFSFHPGQCISKGIFWSFIQSTLLSSTPKNSRSSFAWVLGRPVWSP